MHAFGTLRASLKFPSKISQVWDDVTILRPASGLTAYVISAYAECRQDLSGPKLQTLTGSELPARILGGIVLHPTTDHRCLAKAPVVRDTLLKVTLTYNKIRSLDASLQCKMLIMKSVQWNWQYYLETWHPLAGEILARHIESEQTSTFYHLFPTLRTLLDEERDPARDILLHHPTEDGGIGLLPFESLQPYFYAKSRNSCAPQAAHKFQFDIRSPPHLSNGSLMTRWHTLFKESITASRTSYISLDSRQFLKTTGFVSWMDTWPTNSWTTLDDESYTLAMIMRFSLFPKTGIHCPTSGKLDLLSPSMRYQHIITCRQCSAFYQTPRHDAVMHVLNRTLHFHTTQSRMIKPFELPVSPDEPKSASDLLVVTGRPFTVDVAVTTTARPAATDHPQFRPLRSRFLAKNKRYTTFGKKTGITNIPFVMGIHGIISPDTLEQIEPLLTHAINPMQLRKDIIANTQMELLRSLYNSTLIISASFSSTTALRQQSVQIPATDTAAVIVPVPRAPANQAPANRASLTPGIPNRTSDLTDLTDDDELTMEELQREHNTRHSASNLSHGPPDQTPTSQQQ